jgi:hypothetical protein
MSDPRTKDPDADKPSPYAVGHGKPPLHTRFQKGQSGNPRGGSRAQSARRARALALEEAYRLVTVREGNKVVRLPALQAMMRNQLALAVKGNGPAQRALLAAIDAMEKELAAEIATQEQAEAKRRPINYLEGARRIAFLFREAYKQMGKPMPAKLGDQFEGLLAAETPKTGSDAGDG